MSGTTPPPGSGPGEEQNPYAQPGQNPPPEQQPWQSAPPPSGPPAWSGPADPGAAAWGQPAGPPPEPPPSMLRAVQLMYVGAGLQVLGVLIVFLRRNWLRDTIAEADTGLTTDEVNTAVDAFITGTVVVGLIAVALWLWMAVKNKQGRSWARVVATIMGGLNILFLLFGLLGGGGDPVSLLLNVVSLALAGYILYLLYRPESSQYYAARSARRF